MARVTMLGLSIVIGICAIHTATAAERVVVCEMIGEES